LALCLETGTVLAMAAAATAGKRIWTFGKPATDRAVLYIRHAESMFNAAQSGYFSAHVEIDHQSQAYWESDEVYDPLVFDAPLSPVGIEQAQRLGSMLKDYPAPVGSAEVEGAAEDIYLVGNQDVQPAVAAEASRVHLAELQTVSVLIV
jgi:hypothetical protein